MGSELRRGIATLVIVLAFAISAVLVSPCDPVGDEAWYYYISKKLDWNWDPHLPFLPPIRWSFMLLFHPFTFNLWTFRISYLIINTTLLVAALLIANKGSSDTALIAALAATFLNPVTVYFGLRAFTSITAGALAALAVALADSPLGLLFAVLAVGSWEGTLFPFFALALTSRKRKMRLLYLIPVVLAIATSFDNLLYGAKLPGWEKGPINPVTWSLSLYPALVVVALSAFTKDAEAFLVSASMPVGLLLVNALLGTYVSAWYCFPAIAVASVYLAKINGFEQPLKFLVALNAVLFATSLPLLASLPRYCCSLEIATFLKVSHAKAVLYKSFWAYNWYPFGGLGVPCTTLSCVVHSWPRYVVSWEPLPIKGLRLIYHEGNCYLYKKPWWMR